MRVKLLLPLLITVFLAGCGANEYPATVPISESLQTGAIDGSPYPNNGSVVVHQYQQNPLPNVEFDPFLKRLMADYQLLQRAYFINAGCNFFEPDTNRQFTKDLSVITIGVRNYFVTTLEMTQPEAAYAVDAVRQTARQEAQQRTNTCLREAETEAYSGYLLAKKRVGQMRLYEFR